MAITRENVLDDIQPEELARLFCDMNNDQQATFFAEIGRIAQGWPGAGWCQQSCSIAGSLNPLGVEVVKTLHGHIGLLEGSK